MANASGTLISGGSYDEVESNEPSNPSIGDTWLDTSGGEVTGKIYADLGNGGDWHILPVQDELQSGRTRELLMLLQDKPIPEIQDPFNIQSGISSDSQLEGSTVELGPRSIGSSIDMPSLINENNNGTNRRGVTFNPNYETESITFTITSAGNDTQYLSQAYILDPSDSSVLAQKSVSRGGTYTFDYSFTAGTDYALALDGGSSAEWGHTYTDPRTDLPFTSQVFDVVGGWSNGSINDTIYSITSMSADGFGYVKNGYATDRFSSPTTEPADFKQWNAIRAIEADTGGSTSTPPIEFEILDSSDTILTSQKIPKSEMADEPFVMRNRVYSVDAGSNGQSDFQIATTGDGGHYGIPIISVVSVKQNGSVLDSGNWSFDVDSTITIDNSNVTISSGDTIEIKYDFDIFDSILQPRVYLSRQTYDESPPSISHFRYEYVI